MAKRQRKATDPVKRPDGLPEPYPSAPVRIGLYVIGTHRSKDPGPTPHAQAAHVFAAMYSAKKFLDALMLDDTWEEINDDKIRTSSGVDINSIYLHDLLKYEMSPAEKSWEQPFNDRAAAHLMRTREHLPRESQAAQHVEEPKATPTEPETKKVSRGAKIKSSADGLVTIGTIAADLGKSSREARGILRKAVKAKTITKPDAGWAYPEDEVDAIKKIINKG